MQQNHSFHLEPCFQHGLLEEDQVEDGGKRGVRDADRNRVSVVSAVQLRLDELYELRLGQPSIGCMVDHERS